MLDYRIETEGLRRWITSAIARILREIADLLEIKNDNPFKIRAYRNAADIAANHPHALATLDERGLREIPGIGKDLAARIREIARDRRLRSTIASSLAEFPPTILDLLHLQGVGPKTVATLYRELGIRTLEDLERAAADGRIRALRGMGAKKEALILKALEERKRHAGRHLLSETHETAAALVAYLRERVPDATIDAGRQPAARLRDLRRPRHPGVGRAAVADGRLRRVSAGRARARARRHKSSVLLRGGFQADLRLVAAESRGAALQYFTGSKAHNIALRDRAIGLGFKLNEYGLFRVDDDARVAGETEEEVYAALGLDWVPPELREMRGEIEAAEAHTLPRLIERGDLRGDLHMHTHRDRRQGRRARDGGGRASRRPRVHRHHRSQPVAGDGQRPGRAPRARARRAHPRDRRGGHRHPAAGRHRMRHPARRHARSRRRLPGRARHRRRVGPLGVQLRTASR